ncbi:MAG TPA: hypothetical protein VM010_00380 [Chitinophagaceae bacterium]|nr:hypothetical protein [Chitinophagaceae bacterium]
MKKLFQIPILLLLLQTAAAQNDSFTLLRRFHSDVVQLAVDNLDNLYLISANGQLKKYNAAGDSISTYNQVKRFGALQTVDVTNPLKLLLFYKDFSTVVVLDRLLTFRTALDLRRFNILQTSAVGQSYDGNIWLFDEYQNKLKKVSEAGVVLLETPDFRTIFPDAILPQQIIDQNGTVYVYDAKAGLYLFDYYGGFKKKLPITGWQNLAIQNNFVTGIQNNRFQYFNMATLLSGTRALPATMQQLQVSNNRLFALSADSVSIYNYPL